MKFVGWSTRSVASMSLPITRQNKQLTSAFQAPVLGTLSDCGRAQPRSFVQVADLSHPTRLNFFSFIIHLTRNQAGNKSRRLTMETSQNPPPQPAPQTSRRRNLPTITTLFLLLLFVANVLEYFRPGPDRNNGLIGFNIIASLRLLSLRLTGQCTE